jgi:23S rRNA (uracil1939-C5)-methyltransferase
LNLNLFHSIWLHFHPASRHDNSIFAHDDKAWECVYGDKDGVEEYFTHIPSPFKHDKHAGSRAAAIVGGATASSGGGGGGGSNMSIKSMQPVLFFPPFVFRQANLNGFENIVKVIRKYLVLPTSSTSLSSSNGAKNLLKVCELYGGVGTIGLNILDKVASLSCSDENPNNEACFMRSLRRLREIDTSSSTSSSSLSALPTSIPKDIRYTTGSATKMVVDLHELRGKDICIVDPPRKGLDKEVTEALLYEADGPKRLIYISCGFKAFQRDFQLLTGSDNSADIMMNSNVVSSKQSKKSKMGQKNSGCGGNHNKHCHYTLVHAEGHILFPGADHIETVAIFDRV